MSEPKREVIKAKRSFEESDDREPGLKEYIIIFAIMIATIVGIYFAFELFYPQEENEVKNNLVYVNAGITDEGFIYPYSPFEGKTVNIEFVYDLTTLEKFSFNQDISKSWLLSANNVTILTPPPLENSTENALLIKSSAKFSSFLVHAMGVSFERSNFLSIGEKDFDCSNSTYEQKIIVFNYSNPNIGVNFAENNSNCMTIGANSEAINFVELVDYTMYDLILK